MAYVKDFMVEAFREHALTEFKRGDGLRQFVMQKPGTGHLLVELIFTRRGIAVLGDLSFGDNGAVSCRGYDVAWFASRKSEDYLCEKFLRKVWQWESCRESLLWMIDPLCDSVIPDEHVQAIADMIRSDPPDKLPAWFNDIPAGETFWWEYDSPTPHETYEALHDLGQWYVDDGLPGYDYPRADAGWLCAMQQRFAELFAERKIVEMTTCVST